MPLNIILGDIIKLRAYCYAPTISQVGINTTYWKCVSAVGPGATDRECVAAYDSALAAIYKAGMPATARYSATGLAIMEDPPSPLQESSEVRVTTSRVAGTAGGNLAPKQVSLVMAIKTGLANRHFNGRIFPPFPPASFFDSNGEVNGTGTTYLTALAIFYASGFTVVGAAGTSVFSLVVRSFFPGSKGPPVVPDRAEYTDFTATIGRSQTGTQRRRSDFGRLNSEPGPL